MQIQPIAVAFAIAFAASPALAQQSDPPVSAASATITCVKRHDHGAERQAPTFGKDCRTAPAKLAKAEKKKTPVQGHDHGKIHKNQ